jgi:hypothetical protein
MRPRFTLIVATTDFSATSDRAVSYAETLPREFGAAGARALPWPLPIARPTRLR